MSNEAFIHAFMDSFQKNVPPALSSVAQMLKDHVRITLEQVLKKMHFVTREEFDIQVMLLRQAQEKISVLQQRLDALEKADNRSKK